MSRGLGVKQRQLLDAMSAKQAESFGGVTHRWRWFTLEICGLVTANTPRSEKVSLTRAVRRMAEQGILETVHGFPYDFFWLRWQVLSVVGPLSRPGRKLWFRPVPDEDVAVVEEALRTAYGQGDVSRFWNSLDALPGDDVLMDFVDWWDWRDEEFIEFFNLIFEGRAGEARESWMGDYLAWIIFGIRLDESTL